MAIFKGRKKGVGRGREKRRGGEGRVEHVKLLKGDEREGKSSKK